MYPDWSFFAAFFTIFLQFVMHVLVLRLLCVRVCGACFPPLLLSVRKRAGVVVGLPGRKAIKQCKMMQKWTEECLFLLRGWELLEKNQKKNAPGHLHHDASTPSCVRLHPTQNIRCYMLINMQTELLLCSFCVCERLIGNIVSPSAVPVNVQTDWIFTQDTCFWLWGKLEQVDEGFRLLQPSTLWGRSKANSWFLFCFFFFYLEPKKAFWSWKQDGQDQKQNCFFPSDSQFGY